MVPAFPIPPAIPRAALVTGGASRLGRAAVLGLAQAGFAVAVHCRSSRAEAEAVAEAARAHGARACVLSADLCNEPAVAALLPAAEAALGPLGVLVNNASAFERDEWHDATRASWDAHVEPNLRAPFVLTQAFARALPGDSMAFSPPLVMTETEVTDMLDRVELGLEDLAGELRDEGLVG